jgi:hypothetical protein
MSATPQQFTATQIARALGKSRQAAQRLLCGVAPSATMIVGGNPASVWCIASLPKVITDALTARAALLEYASTEELFARPVSVWKPSVPLNKISQPCIHSASKLQRALRRALVLQDNINVSRVERERIGLEDYAKEFGAVISDRYLRKLIKRTMDRDGGAGNWDRLEIYLPEKPETKKASPQTVLRLAPELCGLHEFVSTVKTPNVYHQESTWTLAFASYQKLKSAGVPSKRAARQVRSLLASYAQYLAPSRDALLKAFNRRLQNFEASGGDCRAVLDRRTGNGERIELTDALLRDIEKLRASTAFANGGRVNSAWREMYPDLSEETRNRWPFSIEAPRKIHELLVREKVDALTARHMRGKLTVRRMIGGVERSWEGIPSMHEWVMDDWTSNIEVTRKLRDGTWELFMPQIVAVMDSASRKFVGWAISSDKGPTAELVCAAALDGFKTHGVPDSIGVENGFVFGNALNINGKEDDQGRTVVAGLAQYGCSIRHFDKMSPTSKSELEKAFDILQRRQERHPGYAGRLQMLDAPEVFKSEGRKIRSGKVAGAEYRYTFQEFVKIMGDIFAQYNSTPQNGKLKGISPNEAHELLRDKTNPHTEFRPELEWILANARYRVHVEVGGVRFTHYGQSIRVRGGRLPSLVGEDLWALVERDDPSLVTFMNLKFSDPFTLAACEKPSAAERLIAPGSGVLGRERAKVREHARAIDDEYKTLVQKHGNPRRDLLMAIREGVEEERRPSARPIEISKRFADSGAAMNQQRAEIKQKKKSEAAQSRNLRSKAARLNVPSILVNDGNEDSRAALDLRAEAAREHAREQAAECKKGTTP